jgi:membrane protein involved in colicin uptake
VTAAKAAPVIKSALIHSVLAKVLIWLSADWTKHVWAEFNF